MIGRGLRKAGKIQSPLPRPIPGEDYRDLFQELTGSMIGLNSRSRAVRLRELGWKPVERSVEDSYEMFELPELLKE